MTKSKMLTLRVEAELLRKIREAAKADRRSVSAQVLHVVRREIDARPVPGRKPLPTKGWLSHLEAPEDLTEFRRVRRELSRRLGSRTRAPRP
jgi:hypothetical protein